MNKVRVLYDFPSIPDMGRYDMAEMPLPGERLTLDFRGRPTNLEVVRSSAAPGEENALRMYRPWLIVREAPRTI